MVKSEVEWALDLLDRVEGHEFSAAIGTASSLDIAVRLVRLHPLIRDILSVRGGNVVETVVRRILQIVDRTVDPRFESPWDTPLLALLVLVDLKSPGTARLIASAIERSPQTAWAREFAQRVLTRPVSEVTHVENVGESVVVRAESTLWSLYFSSNTGDTEPTPDVLAATARGSAIIEFKTTGAHAPLSDPRECVWALGDYVTTVSSATPATLSLDYGEWHRSDG